VAKIIGINDGIVKKAVKNFKGLEHRLEFVKIVNGVKYYNDSFATTPESAITALKSFAEPIVLLAGGAEKKSGFKQLAEEIKKKVQFMVLLDGKATPRLKKELIKANFPQDRMFLAKNIKQAVREAGKNAVKGGIVLLSPACASFGMFRNYKERGELFKEEVTKLK
ncbi:MAG: cyanophycin synthetase, partial [bacterium]|nr:cyanophycin synthetase [bacterium]